MVLICPQMKTSFRGIVAAIAVGELSKEGAGVRSQGVKEECIA